MPDEWERALAVVAHPDDLEYGASGAIAAWVDAGKSVVYLLVTRGEAGIDGIEPERCGPLREQEQIAAAAAVGVDVVEFLDHADGQVAYGTDLRRDIAAAIRRHRPELVVTINHHDNWATGGWNMADHRHVGRATLDAVLDAGNRWIHPELAGAGLEPWGGVRWVAVAGSPSATHAVEIGATLDRAIASLEAHAEYLHGLGDAVMADARRFLTKLADDNAPRFGGRPSTSFELIGL
ncbi:MAG: PIG-L deacetylase family protein [Acidimicrobiia bacterium]